MRIDALMAALDTQKPADSVSHIGVGGGGESPFGQLLASFQGEGMVHTDPMAMLTGAENGSLLPLTDLLIMMGQYSGATEGTPAEMGDVLLSAGAEPAIPLTEALAALQMLINQGTGSEADASQVGGKNGDRNTPQNASSKDDGQDAVLGLVVPVLYVVNPTGNPAAAATDSTTGPGMASQVPEPIGTTVTSLPPVASGESNGSEFGQTMAQNLKPGHEKPAPAESVAGQATLNTMPEETAPSLQQASETVTAGEQVKPLPAAVSKETPTNAVESVSDQTPVFYARGAAPIETGTVANLSVEIQAPVDVQDTPVVDQIVSAVDLISQDGDTEVRLRLHPKELGQLLVRVHMARGDVSIHMVAETTTGQAVIQEHLAQLRDAFRNQGLTVEGLSVTVGSDSSAFNAPTQQQARQSQDLPFLVATESLHEKPNVAESQTSSSWLHGRTHTVDYHV